MRFGPGLILNMLVEGNDLGIRSYVLVLLLLPGRRGLPSFLLLLHNVLCLLQAYLLIWQSAQ